MKWQVKLVYRARRDLLQRQAGNGRARQRQLRRAVIDKMIDVAGEILSGAATGAAVGAIGAAAESVTSPAGAQAVVNIDIAIEIDGRRRVGKEQDHIAVAKRPGFKAGRKRQTSVGDRE